MTMVMKKEINVLKRSDKRSIFNDIPDFNVVVKLTFAISYILYNFQILIYNLIFL